MTHTARDIFRRAVPRFHRTLTNESAPGGAVDMYSVVDSVTGDTLVGLSVPHGRGDIADFVAAALAAYAGKTP